MTQNETPDTNALSLRQLDALPYLVSSPTLSEAARLACIARATLHRWLNDPAFRRELERRRSEAAELATAELSGLMLKATHVLADAMEHRQAAVRLRASHIAVNAGMKTGEFKEFGERIERIDEALRLFLRRRPFP